MTGKNAILSLRFFFSPLSLLPYFLSIFYHFQSHLPTPLTDRNRNLECLENIVVVALQSPEWLPKSQNAMGIYFKLQTLLLLFRVFLTLSFFLKISSSFTNLELFSNLQENSHLSLASIFDPHFKAQFRIAYNVNNSHTMPSAALIIFCLPRMCL